MCLIGKRSQGEGCKRWISLPQYFCLDGLADRLGPLFPRSETRDRALRYLQGLLSQCERKYGWHLAEWLGDATPDGVQYLLERARWDAKAMSGPGDRFSRTAVERKVIQWARE